MIACPGCGALFEPRQLQFAERMSASGECLEAYHTLTASTLSLGDAAFVHQHAVDAYAAQHAGPRSPAIGVFFALAGVYLALERGKSGREVQRAHMAMARGEKRWPSFEQPVRSGRFTVVDALAQPDLPSALNAWMESVWAEWAAEQARVRSHVDALL